MTAVDPETLPEARGWLSTNANEYALATNRFGATANALEFVNELYNAGALTVRVRNILNEEWRLAEHGGPYATSLLTELPSDPSARTRIFAINHEEADREGLEHRPDNGQRWLLFWWD